MRYPLYKLAVAGLLGLVAATGSPAVLLAGEKPSDAEIAELAESLGAEDFNIREKATRRLLEIGVPAVPLLSKAAESRDPEIRARAKSILRDISLGIKLEWPEELKKKIRGFRGLETKEKKLFLKHFAKRPENESAPFLISVVSSGGPVANDASKVLLSMEKREIWSALLLAKWKKPSNKYAARLLAEAIVDRGGVKDIAKAVEDGGLDDASKNTLADFGEAILADLLENDKNAKAAKHAAELSKLFPDKAILQYLRAEALSRLGDTKEAEALEEKALSLHPEDEAPHFSAGDALIDAGLLIPAEKEWRKILEIPPKNSIYDLNAYLRLSSIYAECGLYAKALKFFQTAIERYEKEKKRQGASLGMLGAPLLKKRSAYLAEMADKEGDAGKLKNIPPLEKTDYMKSNVKKIVKNGRKDEMEAALKNVELKMNIAIRPRSLRIPENNAFSIQYNRKEKRIEVLLSSTVLAKWEWTPKGESPSISFFCVDTYYIYRYHRRSGKLEPLDKFEMDYIVAIKKDTDIRYWRDAEVAVDGKKRTWKELAKGIELDYLPEKMEIVITGTSPNGFPKRKKCSLTFDQ